METSIPVLAVADRNHAGFGPKFMDDLPARSARRGRGLGWGVEHEAFQPNRFLRETIAWEIAVRAAQFEVSACRSGHRAVFHPTPECFWA